MTNQATPAIPALLAAGQQMNEVWVMETGERGEGGRVIGIYADRGLARDDFIAEAVQMCDRFGDRAPDLSEHREDGSLRVEVRCDWLTLTPCPVVTAPRLPRAGSGSSAAGSRKRPARRLHRVPAGSPTGR